MAHKVNVTVAAMLEAIEPPRVRFTADALADELYVADDRRPEIEQLASMSLRDLDNRVRAGDRSPVLDAAWRIRTIVLFNEVNERGVEFDPGIVLSFPGATVFDGLEALRGGAKSLADLDPQGATAETAADIEGILFTRGTSRPHRERSARARLRSLENKVAKIVEVGLWATGASQETAVELSQLSLSALEHRAQVTFATVTHAGPDVTVAQQREFVNTSAALHIRSAVLATELELRGAQASHFGLADAEVVVRENSRSLKELDPADGHGIKTWQLAALYFPRGTSGHDFAEPEQLAVTL